MISMMIWALALYIAYYSLQYARLVYRENNKLGAMMVVLLAAASIITPYFIDIS